MAAKITKFDLRIYWDMKDDESDIYPFSIFIWAKDIPQSDIIFEDPQMRYRYTISNVEDRDIPKWDQIKDRNERIVPLYCRRARGLNRVDDFAGLSDIAIEDLFNIIPSLIKQLDPDVWENLLGIPRFAEMIEAGVPIEDIFA